MEGPPQVIDNTIINSVVRDGNKLLVEVQLPDGRIIKDTVQKYHDCGNDDCRAVELRVLDTYQLAVRYTDIQVFRPLEEKFPL